MDKREKAIEIKNLYVSLNGHLILRDINLDIAQGDFLGIIGPNGGGKSTLLKTILGLIKPDYGSIKILGKGIKKGRHYIGYVPQYAQFDRDFPISVEEVVLQGRLGKRKIIRYSKADLAKVEEILTQLEIDNLYKRQIGELSGGERQRVLVARALASNPKILLLDEPTASTDERFSADFYDLLNILNQTITIVLVSHDISAISTYVKNIACLNHDLFQQGGRDISAELINELYNCPVDLIAHGIPHRVLEAHNGVVNYARNTKL
ncbi:MAG TPA: ABC transporter ATP-binding protein [Syntrophomonadaceae bacterium]|nr:ABC transporter ATP-binding protein [Syntrophomonadaceae bacterium]